MEQRTLRLGDILDDYCPRERRVTNHAVVAMIEEDVKQTRCTTCDAEHPYKGGKAPRRRKKDATTVLYEEVLAGMPEAPERRTPEAPSPTPQDESPLETMVADESTEPVVEPEPPTAVAEEPERPPEIEDGPFHRRLIRATLPRPEGQKETRQAPDFTIRSDRGNGHNPYRGDRSRLHGPGGSGSGGGNVNRGGGGRRFTGGGDPGMPGSRGGRGPGRPGFGGGSNPPRQGGPSPGSGRGPSTGSGRGGRKRSR
jgi:hypothetical protein